jgi:hypothetical protein
MMEEKTSKKATLSRLPIKKALKNSPALIGIRLFVREPRNVMPNALEYPTVFFVGTRSNLQRQALMKKGMGKRRSDRNNQYTEASCMERTSSPKPTYESIKAIKTKPMVNEVAVPIFPTVLSPPIDLK